MNDDGIDKTLVEAMRDYNEPGAVPRNEMWAAIQAARHANAPDRQAAGTDGRRRRPWLRVGALAAALLLVGVAIGRRTARPGADHSAAGGVVSRMATPLNAPAVAAGVSSKPPTAAADSTAQFIGSLRKLTQGMGQRVRALAATEQNSAINGRGDTSPRSAAGEANNLAYRLVVLQHLAGTEAMITSFRASAKRGVMDAEISGWSRELLSTTRMLETSTATTDPVMKRLLEDLDLVIAQILQYTARGTNDAEELELIEQSINRRGVITKLRSTLPGRTLSAGT